jgi:hypothetical protein
MGYQEQIFEQSAALGGEVDAALKPARSWLAKADELNRQLGAARAAEEAEHARLVEVAASSGKLPELNGHGRWIYDSPSSKLVVASVALCHVKASGAVRAAGPALFAAMQKRIAKIVEESAKLAATVPPGVVDEMSALRAEQHDTWRRLRQLVDAWDRCFELLAVAQRAGVIDGPSHPRDVEGAQVFQKYWKPLLLPGRYRVGPGETRLARAVASGAQPGMYSWESALERFERWNRTQKSYAPMNVTTVRDSMGNVIAEDRGPESAGEFVPRR